MIGLIVPIEFAEARGPDEPCSFMKPNSYLKISNEPWTCQKVNYWVPEKCGIIEGLYKTDLTCHEPTKEEREQREQQLEEEREQREQQLEEEREQQRQLAQKQQQLAQQQQEYWFEQQRLQEQQKQEQQKQEQPKEKQTPKIDSNSNSKITDSSDSPLSFFSNMMKSITQFFDSLFSDSDTGENMIQNLQKKLPLSDNPPIRHEQQYNPGKDQYLTQKNPSYQNMPPSQRPWNP